MVMKCIIYGIGSGRLKVERYLKCDHEIIGYSDSFFKGKKFQNKIFYSPEELLKINFDILIIAIGDEKISEDICNKLIVLGIKKRKILNFYQTYMYKYQKHRKYPLEGIRDRQYEGLILGLSHSYFGIDTKYLNADFCNLAIGSQDLFYNLKVVEFLMSSNSAIIKNLKYAIIDMHKYTYFNYDVSLSKKAITYYNNSGFGYLNSHNYEFNKNFERDIEYELNCIKLKKDQLTEDGTIELLNELFDTDPIKNITREDIDVYKKTIKLSSLQKKRFENTIQENIKNFDLIINRLKEINRNIEIYIILIPQHKVVEDFEKVIEKNLKKEFYEILHRFEKKHKFKVLDFKNNEESYYLWNI